ncbi:t-SNARE [Ascobolus immersus RN42]|uniref:t-SNARE n=1 Tax=Ascobolus immersus RN42 TaxID=1160509 RepID=A0A3N4HQM9_ASCIM|nr:t-SNARE [Ascobolus immersus RN42]
MSIQDRTHEFHSFVSLVSRRIKRPASTRPYTDDPRGKKVGPRSEFGRQAAEVGRSLGDVGGKLERLGQLAHKTALFDDRPVEVAELTYIIKSDLSLLNTRISALSTLTRDTTQPQTVNAKEHAKQVVLLLQARLSKATLEFKELLEVRTRNIQAGRERREEFIGGVAAPIQRANSPLYPTQQGTTTTQASLSRRNIPAATLNPSLSLEPDLNNPYSAASSQQQLLLQEQDTSSAFISARTEAIDTIERTIHELGGIFSQLAEMVAVQGEQIQRIDEDVEVAGGYVEGAQGELMKFMSRAAGARGRYVKMFGVLMVFFLLWVMVSG